MRRDIIALDAKSVRRLDENGYLHIDRSPFTKEQVAPYRGFEIPGWQSRGLDPQQIYKGYRPASELSKPATVKSINNIPVQLNHHEEDPQNPATKTRVGSTGEAAEWCRPYLMNSITIWEQRAIDRIRDGSMRELSLAYRYDPEWTSGETADGEQYDFIMRNISANHLALVEEGRAGRDVLVYDSAAPVSDDADSTESSHEAKKQMDETLKTTMQQLVSVLQTLLANDTTAVSGGGAPKAAPAEMVTDNDPDVAQPDSDEQQAAPVQATADDDDDVVATEDEDAVTADEDCVKAKDEDDTVSDDDDAVAEDEDEGQITGDEDDVDAEDEDDAVAEDEDDLAEDEDEDDEAKAAADMQTKIQEALNKAGLSKAPEEVKKAFINGAKAMATIGRAQIAQDTNRVVRKINRALKAKSAAAISVRPVLGRIDPMAYDHAGEIYKDALKKMGISTKGLDAKSARAAYLACASVSAKSRKRSTMAADSNRRVQQPSALSNYKSRLK